MMHSYHRLLARLLGSALLAMAAGQAQAQVWELTVQTRKLCPKADQGRMKYYRATPGVIVTVGGVSKPTVLVDAFNARAEFFLPLNRGG